MINYDKHIQLLNKTKKMRVKVPTLNNIFNKKSINNDSLFFKNKQR